MQRICEGISCFLACLHPIFVVNSTGIVMFSEMCGVFVNDVIKFIFDMMIDVCIKCVKIHMADFLGGNLFTILYDCIFVCILVWECRHSRLRRGRNFGWCFLLWKSTGDFRLSGYSCPYTLKDISTERCGWFVIIWMFMSIQIKYMKKNCIFRSEMSRVS